MYFWAGPFFRFRRFSPIRKWRRGENGWRRLWPPECHFQSVARGEMERGRFHRPRNFSFLFFFCPSYRKGEKGEAITFEFFGRGSEEIYGQKCRCFLPAWLHLLPPLSFSLPFRLFLPFTSGKLEGVLLKTVESRGRKGKRKEAGPPAEGRGESGLCRRLQKISGLDRKREMQNRPQVFAPPLFRQK